MAAMIASAAGLGAEDDQSVSGESEVETEMEMAELEDVEETDDADKKRRWVKEIGVLKHLPYYERLCEQADYQLAAIKHGLAHSILLRDVRPAFLHWICELDK